MSLFSWLLWGGYPDDDREEYVRDADGRILALRVGEGSSHEDYIHDGTPHQNPAMRTEMRGWFIFARSVEVSYYPFTDNGHGAPDLDKIRRRVDEGQRRGEDVDLVALDDELEREVVRRENGQQMVRDVPPSKLQYNYNGKRRR